MTCGAPSAPAVARWPTRCASRKRRASAVQLAIEHLATREFRLGLGEDRAVAPFVARREVEDLQPADARRAREGTGLARGQVVAARRLLQVLLEEGGLAEEHVGARREPHDCRRISRREE